MTANSATYVAGKVDEYYYPELGDPAPPGGAQVNLLTKAGTCIRGQWPSAGNNKNGFYLGWAPFPKRNHERERQLQALRATLAP